MPPRGRHPRQSATRAARQAQTAEAPASVTQPSAAPAGESAVSPRPPLRVERGRLLVPVRVVPRAGRESLSLATHEIAVRLLAPPVDGAANDALIALLAARLRVPRRAVTIVRGATARHKLVAIESLDAAEFWRRLAL